MNECRRVRVYGRVQGVSFRAYTQRKAQQLGITGWVQNQPDGSVAAEFHGPPEAMAAMLAWCEMGSPAALVDRVESQPCPPAGDPPAYFLVRH